MRDGKVWGEHWSRITTKVGNCVIGWMKTNYRSIVQRAPLITLGGRAFEQNYLVQPGSDSQGNITGSRGPRSDKEKKEKPKEVKRNSNPDKHPRRPKKKRKKSTRKRRREE